MKENGWEDKMLREILLQNFRSSKEKARSTAENTREYSRVLQESGE